MSVINLLVEGEIDEAIARKLIIEHGHEVGVCYGKQGADYIKRKIQDFNKSAQNISYLAMVDFMDTKCVCAVEVVQTWLPYPNQLMIFRVVVREIESWLMADRPNIADFLKVNIEQIPIRPEEEFDPKLKLINVARKSRSKRIRDAVVPEHGSTAQVGKLYNEEMKHFISNFWSADNAQQHSKSLSKCLIRLKDIPS